VKRLLLLLLLSQVWALTVTKEVSGPELVDVNETLQVSIEVESDEPFLLERVEDEIPLHFVAVDFPSGCEQTGGELVCNFGYEVDRAVVNYRLRSVDVGYGVFGSPRVYYEGGVKTADYLRPYFVGRPKVDLNLEGNSTLLPGEDVVVSVELSNPGAKPLPVVVLTLNYTGGSLEEELSLSPGESLRKSYVLGKAGKEGGMDITATASWGNSSTEKEFSVLYIYPEITVERKVAPIWRVEEGELRGRVLVTYRLSNRGTASGNASFLSGRSLELSPGETKVVREVFSAKAPAEKVSITDARGSSYGTFYFPEETPELKKGFLALLYEGVGSSIPSWLLLALLAGSLFFSTRFDNPTIKAGFFLLALVSAVLLYSQYSVGALP